MTHLDVGFLTFLLGVGIPLLTGLITKVHASSGVKSVVTLTLVVAATAVQRAVTVNGVVDLKTWATTALVTWIVAISTYYGLLKPTGTADVVSSVAPNFGIGPASSPAAG